MKPRAAAVQGGLAALGLIAAYTTWQREPERRPGEVVVISATQNDIQKVRYEDNGATPPKWAEIEWRKEADGPHPWLHVSARPNDKVPTPERELRGNEASAKTLEKFSPLKASRALGVLAADKLKELGLDAPKKKIEVTVHGQKRTLLLGNSPFGMSDPYVRDESDNKVYVLTGGVSADLDNAALRLIDRQLHDWKTSEFDALTVTAADKKRELVQTSPETPAQAKLASKTGKTDDLAKNWHDKMWKLIVSDVLGKGEAPKNGEPVIALRIDYSLRGRPRGFMEVGRVAPKPPEPSASSAPPPVGATEIYARTESTAGWVKLGGNAEPLLVEGAKIAASAD